MIENLPFDENKLFYGKMDKSLHFLKDLRHIIVPQDIYLRPAMQIREVAVLSAPTQSLPSLLPTPAGGFMKMAPLSMTSLPCICHNHLLDPLPEAAKPPPMPPTWPHIVFGDRLSPVAHNWGKISMNSWVLEIIHHGYSIEFLSFLPHQPPFPPTQVPLGDSFHQHIFQQEADTVLLKGDKDHVPHHYTG